MTEPTHWVWALCSTCRQPRARYETFQCALYHNRRLNPRRDFIYAPAGPWGVPDGYRERCGGHKPEGKLVMTMELMRV